MAACTSVRLPGAPVAAGTTMGSGSPSPSATAVIPPNPAFDTVIKGAERQDGLLPVWKRQDKVWIELAPSDFGKAFYLSPKLNTGLGEAGFFGGLLSSRWAQFGRPQWVEFRKSGQQVQLIAVNASFIATPGSPEASAVQAAYSPSLLGSVVASAPHGERGTVLVEVSSLLTGDVLGLGIHLQRAFRQGYSLDARNTVLTQARSSASGLVFEVQQHYFSTSIGAATGTPTTGPQPTVPVGVPDVRSLFLTVQYTLSALPPQAMPVRLADPRVGYFTTTVADFSQDLARTPRQRFVNRWRLEKKDPKAALSEPVRSITYWLDKSIPKEYASTIRDGILAWNKAFEAIGYKDAIVVRESSNELPADLVGNGQAIIRWMTNNRPSFGAIGPSHVDPRTGEILTADIGMESLSSRAIRAVRSQILVDGNEGRAGEKADPHHAGEERCEQADMASEQLAYGLDVLSTRDGLDPDSPQAKAFILAYIKDTTMHEVGHTLGLQHNFRASRWHTLDQLNQLDLTTREGKSASVMDYAPINLNVPGQPAGAPFQTVLGPYDFWAIEYGYKPLSGTPAEQKAALQAIAARSQDPAWRHALDFGNDEDFASGLDAYSLTFDLGRDPVAFARQRLAIARDLIARQTHAKLGSDDEPAVLRRRVLYAVRDISRITTILARQVGGLVSRRDGPESTRALLDPLPAADQRAALSMLIDGVLGTHALTVPPALQRRLAPDYFERDEGALEAGSLDFSVAEQLNGLRRQVLNALMNEDLAERLLDNIDKTRDRERSPLTVRELHRSLREAIWPIKPSDAGDAAPWVRNLQRDYVNRLTASMLRGSERADIRAQVRQQARTLVEQLQRSPKGDPDSTEQAHRRDCLETLQRALSATVLRSTP